MFLMDRASTHSSFCSADVKVTVSIQSNDRRGVYGAGGAA